MMRSLDRSSRNLKELPNLDLLRSMAVLFVVLDHTLKFMGFPRILWFKVNDLGMLGVLFFFVHTALVLMFSLQRDQGLFKGWRFFASFYMRRFFRIYPLSVACILVVVAFQIPSHHIIAKSIVYEPASSARIIANLLLAQDILGQRDILGQFWSLPLEVEMYILLPFIFILLSRFPGVGAAVLLWCLAVLIPYFMPDLHMGRSRILQFIPNFLPGVIAYVLFKDSKPRFSAGWLFLLIMVFAFVYTRFPRTECGWIVCLILGGAIPFFTQIRNQVLKNIVHQVARFSYGVYVSHVFCLWLAFMALSFLPIYIQFLLYGMALFVIPFILYHLIERPGIQLGVRMSRLLCPH